MIIAIDTGGTKTLIGRFTDEGALEKTVRLATPADPATYVETICEHIVDMAGMNIVTQLSIALPGIVDDGIALACTNLGWYNVPIRDMLATSFPEASIILDNDANLAGLASVHRLSLRPRCGLCLTIGTGIGSSIILDGQIHPGLCRCEAGHIPITYQGRTTSWEHIASARALQQAFGTLDPDTSQRTWDEVAERLAIGLRMIVATVQPDAVVIGGGLGLYVDRFSSSLLEKLAASLPDFITLPSIISAPHTEEIVLYGCYDNVRQHRPAPRA